MLLVYFLSIVVYVSCLRKMRISINNVFAYIFLGFQLLYPLSIVIVSSSGIADSFPSDLGSFFEDERIISEVLKTSSIAIITFSCCMYFFPVIKETDCRKVIPRIEIWKRFFWVFLPFALYLNSISNWSTGERVGLIPSLAAYFRNILTVITVVLFVSDQVTIKKKFLYLVIFGVITMLSTQRTNALIVIIAFIYTIKSKKEALIYCIGGLLALIVLGAVRNEVSATDLAYPIFGEGIYGAWGFLQAIDVTKSYGYSLAQLFMVFNSSLNWFFNLVHIPLSFYSFDDLISKTGYEYYPMGGFFYLSDAYLMHPIIGPILYTLLIYWIYRKNLNKYYQSHTPLNLIFVALLFDAVKGALSTFVAMIVFHYLFYKMLEIITKAKFNVISPRKI